jgi:hypothetical protein
VGVKSRDTNFRDISGGEGAIVVTSKKGFHDWGYLTDVGKYIFFFSHLTGQIERKN